MTEPVDTEAGTAPTQPEDLVSIHEGHDLRPAAGQGRLAPLRRLLYRLLAPFLERQSAWNASSARVASELWERSSGLLDRQRDLDAAVARNRAELHRDLDASVTALRAELLEPIRTLEGQVRWLHGDRQDARHAHATTAARELEELVRRHDRALDRLGDRLVREVNALGDEVERRLAALEERLDLLAGGAAVPAAPGPAAPAAAGGARWLEGLYAELEDAFRGSPGDIRERLRVYLPFVQEATEGLSDPFLVDLGCGRGEWLELLRDQGRRARGVDLSRAFVADCRSRGLDAVEADAGGFLRGLGDGTVAMVTAFHLVEHLPFDRLVTLLDETARVLRPGGIAVFETPDPANLQVGSNTFHLDPSHRRPLPSPLLRFLVEARGLVRVQLLALHPYPDSARLEDEGDELTRRFDRLIYGPQDYAVIGRRP